MKRFTILVVIAAGLAGCASKDIERIEGYRATAEQVRSATTQAVDQARTVASALPEGSAERLRLEKFIAEAEKNVARADQVLDAADGAILTLKTGELDPKLTEALDDLPYGGWIVLAMSLGLAGWKAWVAARTKGDLKTVIRSIDVALPEKSPHVKEMLRLTQGEAVTQRVKALRE